MCQPTDPLLSRAVLTLGVMLGYCGWLGAQEPRPIAFESARGLKVKILVEQADFSEEELAQALEQAAQQLRQPKPPIRPAASPAEPVAIETPTNDAAPTLEHRPRWMMGPPTLLWTPPLANPWEPRLTLKRTSLDNHNTVKTFDTAIGTTVGLLRRNLDSGDNDALQIDFFGVAFNRWSKADRAVAMDYRFGLPLTAAVGRWQAKLGYEHISTHLGDEFLLATWRPRLGMVRDEMVAGLGHWAADNLRLYGQVGYAFGLISPVHDDQPWRFDGGVEWCSQAATGKWGKPFAALDVEARGEQSYTINVAGQAGWMWRGRDDGPSLRLALEYYDGRSPFGQFFRDHETWWGINVALGF